MDNANTTAPATYLHGTDMAIAPRLEPVSADEIRWDGSLPTTTHKVRLANASRLMGRDVFAHVEVRETGRAVRSQRVPATDRSPSYGPVTGMRCQMRFTGCDDSHEWMPGVLVTR